MEHPKKYIWLAFIANVAMLFLMVAAAVYSPFDDNSLVKAAGFLSFIIGLFALFFEILAVRELTKSKEYFHLVSVVPNMAITIVFLWFSYAIITSTLPSNSPEICFMPPGVSCPKFSLSASTSKLNFTIVHGFEKPIIITGISCTKKQGQYEEVRDVSIGPRQYVDFSVSCNDENGNPMSFSPGDIFKGKINFEYYFSGEEPDDARRPRTMSGDIYVKAS
ncbi:MAG: hypothetical protein ABIF01_02135 [Candidatus Micrarchaeota archaeon]